MDADFYSVALSLVPGVGSVTFKRLIECFKSAEAVLNTSLQELKEVEGLRVKTALAIKNFNDEAVVEKRLWDAKKTGARILTLENKGYPINLFSIHNPPPVLYIKGEIRKEDRFSVAVVGSRFYSSYGEKAARSICRDLVSGGMTIISGMARGIDSFSHHEAIYNGGRTIAVLGNGIDIVYPWENRNLFDKISKNGAVITEFPVSTPPDSINFPKRNRIISGLSLGVVVVEAGIKSGSLITAGLALRQGRKVFSVPGPIGSTINRGTNKLIKDGAVLVESGHDIINTLSPQHRNTKKINIKDKNIVDVDLSKNAELIISTLTKGPLHIDTIVAESGLNVHEVSSTLLSLELNNLITQLPGKVFIVNS